MIFATLKKLIRGLIAALVPALIIATFALLCAWIDGYRFALPASGWFRIPFIFVFLYTALCGPAVIYITGGAWLIERLEER